MKNPQQLSEEILRKISVQKEKQKRIYKNLQRMAVLVVIAAIVVPVSLHLSSTANMKNFAPSGGNNMEAAPPNDAGNATNSNSSIFDSGWQKPEYDAQGPGNTGDNNHNDEDACEDGWEEEVAPYPGSSNETATENECASDSEEQDDVSNTDTSTDTDTNKTKNTQP